MLPKNSELIPLSFLIGTWSVEMTHVALPNPLRWQDSFEWLDDAFIIWHWEGKNEVPKATLIIGRNENSNSDKYTMLYYDARGVSRVLTMTFVNNTWKFWREGEDFYQRFEGAMSEDGNSITGIGEMSRDGGKTWEHDYNISYKRVE